MSGKGGDGPKKGRVTQKGENPERETERQTGNREISQKKEK